MNELERIVAELNRAAPGSRNQTEIQANTASLDQMLIHAEKRGASDLLIIAGAPVTLRLNGALTSAGSMLSAEECRSLLTPLLTARQYEQLQRAKSVDFCFTRETGRFRANIHHQRGTLAGSIRLLPSITKEEPSQAVSAFSHPIHRHSNRSISLLCCGKSPRDVRD